MVSLKQSGIAEHMKKKFQRIFIWLLIFIASNLSAQLEVLETKNLRLIYYSKGHEYIVPHLARSFENALSFHERLFDYKSDEKITILLEDFGDFGNAGAISIPNNYIKVSLAPFSYVYEIRPANERMNWMMNHELVHIVASDKAADSDRFFRKLFAGKIIPTPEDPISIYYSYLTNPREYAPRWYHEGAAVFLETWMAGGLGRAIGPYDEMVFRSKVMDSTRIYDMIGLESEGTTIDFQVGANSYLYGTRFISYLGYRYGPDSLINWISRSKGSKRYYAGQFRNIYGIPIDHEWENWINWEHSWQQSNLDSIRVSPVTKGRRISDTALGSVSRAYYLPEKNKILTAIRYPGQVSQIAEIELATGEIKEIQDITGPALYFVTSLVYDPEQNMVFYTTNNYGWRSLNKLDLKNGKSERLMKEARIGDLALNPEDRSLWGVRHFNGISTLVRIVPPYTEWDQIYSFPYGNDLFDLDISPDGAQLTAALAQNDGTQKLIIMNPDTLMAGTKSYDILFDFDVSSPANFVFSEDGNYIYGSSYYSGVSNIFRYDFSKSDMEILSNAESGFFRPIPVPGDSIIVFEYTGEGFVPVMIANKVQEHDVGAIEYLGNHIIEKYPELQNWTLGSPRSIQLDSLQTYRGEYSTFKNIRLNSIYPIVQGYKKYAAFGLRSDFSDGLGLSGLSMTASYTPNVNLPMAERFHVGLQFNHWNWKVFTGYNHADFYDLFGPTKTSRKGYSLGAEYKESLVYDEPKMLDLVIHLEGHAGLERLPDYQNVAAPSEELVSARIALEYEFIRKSLGAVDDERGVKWELVSHNDFVNQEYIFMFHNNFDFGISLPINHSSVWLRSSLGYSFGERNNPFANFFFGGFGNNWIDHRSEKRYRHAYSFPGSEINAFGGKNYAKFLIEWNLPPIRFRHFGFPALYANWLRTALFTAAIRTNIDGDPATEPLPQYGFRRTLFNVGAQVDFRLVLFSNLSSFLSLGYARAFEEDVKVSDELMISLKVM